jgi:hypothetical protein
MAHANKYTINVQPVPSKTSAEEVAREMKLRLNAASITLLSNSGESHGRAYLDFASAVDATSAQTVLDGTAAFGVSTPLQARHQRATSSAITKRGNGAEDIVESRLLQSSQQLTDFHLKSCKTLQVASELSMISGKTQTVSNGETTNEVTKHADGTVTTLRREFTETSTVFRSRVARTTFANARQHPADGIPTTSVDVPAAPAESANMRSLLKNGPLEATAIPSVYASTFNSPLSYKKRGQKLSAFLLTIPGVVELPARPPSICSWYGLGKKA